MMTSRSWSFGDLPPFERQSVLITVAFVQMQTILVVSQTPSKCSLLLQSRK